MWETLAALWNEISKNIKCYIFPYQGRYFLVISSLIVLSKLLDISTLPKKDYPVWLYTIYKYIFGNIVGTVISVPVYLFTYENLNAIFSGVAVSFSKFRTIL